MIYDGHIGNAGYGLDYDPDTQKTIGAHRLSFKRAYGYLPKVVMHTCDTPTCVNPEHLKAGTQSDNIQDAISKGRYKKQTKLTKEQVLAILEDTRSCKKVAVDYNVNPSTIHNVRIGRTYSDISGKGGSCGS